MPTAIAVPTAESLLATIFSVTHKNVRKMSFKYAARCPSPTADAEDFTQNVYVRLLEWLGDARHREQAEGLLENPIEVIRFMQSFSRSRICDQIDVFFAGNRDQRLTLHASHQGEDGSSGHQFGSTPLMDLLTPETGCVVEPDHGEALERVRRHVPALSKRLLDALVDPPDDVREAFLESRVRISRGVATLEEPGTEHGECALELVGNEGYMNEDSTIYWPGPLRRGNLDTTAGPARLTLGNASIVIRFESRLTVRVNWHTMEGFFVRESIRPSPAAFDIGVMADYLGVKLKPVRDAWIELKDALRGFAGYEAPDIPLD